MELIDAILYINLAHRTDRNEHILQEIGKLCGDPTKIHRIDAIRCDEGALGCSLSHIKALRYALEHERWNRVLVLEDDFTFQEVNLEDRIRSLLLLNIDVGLLSFNHNRFESIKQEGGIHKVLYSQTTSSYVVTRSYIPTLLENFIESSTDMQHHGKHSENCLDIHWTLLQPNANWYAIVPAIGYQFDNYSDIERQHASYGC